MNRIQWVINPKIGWWIDQDPLVVYCTADYFDIDAISKAGIIAPTTGIASGSVILTIDPYTAYDNGSYLGIAKRRAIVKIEMPMKWAFDRMNKSLRGNNKEQINRLLLKERYDAWQRTDVEYYTGAVILIVNHVPSRFIKGYMLKG
jgi:hypothetical protein